MNEVLKGEEYEIMKKDPLQSCTAKIGKVVKELKHVIREDEKYLLKVDNTVLPRFYGLPKLHKVGNKMRPITNCINSPSYKIAKWLVSEFKGLKKFKNYSVKNLFEVVEKTKNLFLEQQDRLISFDVCALFPSIPRERMLNLLEKWLKENELNSETVEEYMKLTRLCVCENYFQFKGKFYRQKEGLAMGSPLSPFLADLFMGDFETHMVTAFPWMFKFWVRYVDDIFAIVHEKHIEDSLKLLNLQDKNIKFTSELEDQKQALPFLDLKLIRCNHKIKFEIHRKDTHSDNYIKFDSYSPEEHKLAAFNSLIYRMVNLPLEMDTTITEYNYTRNS